MPYMTDTMIKHSSSPSPHPSQIIRDLDIAQLVLGSFKALDNKTREFAFQSDNKERTAVTRFAVQILIDVARECAKVSQSAALVASGTFRGSNAEASKQLKELVTTEMKKLGGKFNNVESHQGADYVIRVDNNQFDTCFAMESEGRAFSKSNGVGEDFDKLLREQCCTRVFVGRVNSGSELEKFQAFFEYVQEAVGRASSARLNNNLLANTSLLVVALVIGEKTEDLFALYQIRFNENGRQDEPTFYVFDSAGKKFEPADDLALQKEVRDTIELLVQDGVVEKVLGTDGESRYRLK